MAIVSCYRIEDAANVCSFFQYLVRVTGMHQFIILSNYMKILSSLNSELAASARKVCRVYLIVVSPMNFTYKNLPVKKWKGIEKKIIHSIFFAIGAMHERYDDKYNGIIALKTSIVSMRHAFFNFFVFIFY